MRFGFSLRASKWEDFDLEDMAMRETLNVVITGASAGLGRAIAHEFGKTGARVGLLSRDLAALEATADEVGRLGGVAATYSADVSDDQAIEAAADSFEERLGPI